MNRFIASLGLCAAVGLATSHADAQAQHPLPPVIMSHVLINLDHEDTYNDFVSSSFLMNNFSGFAGEIQSGDGEGRTWTGLMFVGEHHVIEFYRPSTAQPGWQQDPIRSALAMSSEVVDGYLGINDALSGSALGPFTTFQAQFATPTGNVDWFHRVYSPHHDGSVSVWFWELNQGFNTFFTGGQAPYEDIFQATAWATVAPPTSHIGKLFQDLIGVDMEVTPARQADYADMFTRLGFQVVHDGDTYVCTGPDSTIRVTAAENPKGIYRIELSLRRPMAPNEIYHFAHGSVLRPTNHGTATWQFR